MLVDSYGALPWEQGTVVYREQIKWPILELLNGRAAQSASLLSDWTKLFVYFFFTVAQKKSMIETLTIKYKHDINKCIFNGERNMKVI